MKELIREDWVTLICEEAECSASGPTMELAQKAMIIALINNYIVLKTKLNKLENINER